MELRLLIRPHYQSDAALDTLNPHTLITSEMEGNQKSENVTPEAGTSKEMDSLLEPPKGTQPCQLLDRSSVRPVSNFRLPGLRGNK